MKGGFRRKRSFKHTETYRRNSRHSAWCACIGAGEVHITSLGGDHFAKQRGEGNFPALAPSAQGGEILLLQRVVASLGDSFVVEPAGEFDLKGFHCALPVHRLVGKAA